MIVTSPGKIIKPWGHEYIYVTTEHYVGKILHINKGHRTSLQYHKIKEETLYVLSGFCEVLLNGKSFLLKTGSNIHVNAGDRHRITAVTDCEIQEISTPHPEDIVRIQDDYNRV